ncbi:hypothetical protein GCM10010390_37930 [Streptomyces mordarskii]|uniref:Uncharacterized protein n=1 Tax=Streptomyces mordarskii TaxID=1226758 RepID=A0ABP3N3A6_9ACTN
MTVVGGRGFDERKPPARIRSGRVPAAGFAPIGHAALSPLAPKAARARGTVRHIDDGYTVH